jgi:hypothetical protein
MPTTPLLLVFNYTLSFKIKTKYKNIIRKLYSFKEKLTT